LSICIVLHRLYKKQHIHHHNDILLEANALKDKDNRLYNRDNERGPWGFHVKFLSLF
jgi:hypothetical protein